MCVSNWGSFTNVRKTFGKPSSRILGNLGKSWDPASWDLGTRLPNLWPAFQDLGMRLPEISGRLHHGKISGSDFPRSLVGFTRNFPRVRERLPKELPKGLGTASQRASQGFGNGFPKSFPRVWERLPKGLGTAAQRASQESGNGFPKGFPKLWEWLPKSLGTASQLDFPTYFQKYDDSVALNDVGNDILFIRVATRVIKLLKSFTNIDFSMRVFFGFLQKSWWNWKKTEGMEALGKVLRTLPKISQRDTIIESMPSRKSLVFFLLQYFLKSPLYWYFPLGNLGKCS